MDDTSHNTKTVFTPRTLRGLRPHPLGRIAPGPSLAGLALLVVFLSGCATQLTLKDREKERQENARESVLDAIEQGFQASDKAQKNTISNNAHRFLARQNPALCDCPEFELYLEGRWVRHHMIWPGDLPPILPQDGLLELTGTLKDSTTTFENQHTYRAFEIFFWRNIPSTSITEALENLTLVQGSSNLK